MNSVRTVLLEIFYEEIGAKDDPAVLVLHGWPDAPRGWTNVARSLRTKGWRTIIPYLRGSRPTRFLSQDTPRFGAGVALAQDAIDLADALNLNRFAVVGHDSGACAAYTMAALFPERLTALAALSLAYQPHGVYRVPEFEQSRRFWYQWFQCVDGGSVAIRRDPVGFARIQWDTWSPPVWFDETEFAATSETFLDPDWAAITLNAYRARWISGQVTDARYDALQRKFRTVERLSTPTLMIQGVLDSCDPPKESEGLDNRHLVMCYSGFIVRRTLIIALALSLAGLGPVPLSACAFFSSKLAECASPKTQSRCDQMNMDESRIQLVAAPETSCCFVSNAPLPESQYKAFRLSLAAPIAVPDPMEDAPRVQRLPPVLPPHDLSPPPLQSLLCTFLI